MDADTSQKCVFIDELWFKKLSRLERASNQFKNHIFTPKLIKNGDLVKIKYRRPDILLSEKEILQEIDHLIIRYDNLAKIISNKEKDNFIKNYYLESINEDILKLHLHKILYKDKLSNEEKNQEIFQIHKQLYPIPTKTERAKFINEFISFLRFCRERNEFNLNDLPFFDELCDHKFYKVKYQNNRINFEEIVKKYIDFFSEHRDDLCKKYKTKEVKRILKTFIKSIGLPDNITVRVKPQYTFSVNSGTRKINVPRDINITKKRLIQIITHEICGHMYRSVQGSENCNTKGEKLKLLGVSKVKDLYIEEGIASYLEQNIFYESDKYDIPNLFNFYLRIIAVHLGLNFEPHKVYEKLDKLASVAVRVRIEDKITKATCRDNLFFRLYRDYEEPTKGCVNGLISQYLIGNRYIWDYIEEGNNVFNLFAGKVHPHNLSHLKSLGFAIPDDFLGEKQYPRDFLINEIIKAL